MVDTCTISRAGAETTDTQTGQISGAATVLYSGKCKVQQTAAATSTATDVGEAYVRLLALDAHLPVVGSEGLAVGDLVTITASVGDADLVGRVFSVQGLAHKTFASARRLACVEVTS